MRTHEIIFQAVKNKDRKTFRKYFLKLHIRDQEELFHLLFPTNKQEIAAFLNPDEFADILEWMTPRNQKEVYAAFSTRAIAGLLMQMESDNIIKFLSYLEPGQIDELLSLVDATERKHIEEMLEFGPKTAGSIMNKSYVVASPNETVKQVAERFRSSAQKVEMVYYVYVLDGNGILRGVVSLRDLIIEPEERQLAEIMVKNVAAVHTDTAQEAAGKLLQEYDLVAVPVLDATGKMVGIITVDDVMDVMTEEVIEDFETFAAITRSSKKDFNEGKAWEIARVRMPWIIILIFMGMFSATLINSFEETLNEVVLLAAFIPIIMNSAGNVGTQSLAVSIRKLSSGRNLLKGAFWKTVGQELLVGLILGLGAGSVLGLIVAIFYGNIALAIIIGISLLLALGISNVVGVLIPVLIDKFRIDPAIASGPFITTINDAIGLLIYFSIATQFLTVL
ncbi:magnesium transporter [Jeotgalibaca sp. A122]|uniref:magnesium transporter n=1 Tax=Jeotgalibaca sp. A122 TaxID=3457322 RepID=UPI003FD3E7EA